MLSLRAAFDRQHEEFLPSNDIDHPIAVLANPIEMLQALDFRGVGGIGNGAECKEPFYEKRSAGGATKTVETVRCNQTPNSFNMASRARAPFLFA
jgi:hypothetical protein